MKRRTDWWRPLGGSSERGRLSAIVTTLLCDASQYAGFGYQGALYLIAGLTAATFHAHKYIHSTTSSKTLFKKLPSLWQTEWHACHLSLPLSEPQPSSGVIWQRHASRASVRHHVNPHWAWLWPGSWTGLEAALAVRCCKWLSELTDGSPSVPTALNLQDQSAYLDPLCALCVYVV